MLTSEQSDILQWMTGKDVYYSPYTFVMQAYAWGDGDLKRFKGPREWQKRIMLEMEEYLRGAIGAKQMFGLLPDFYRHAIASGRGPGKSALVGMLAHWFLSTRIGGSTWVAANGEPQLRTKTFPEISKWVARGINSSFFELNALSVQPATWFKNYIESPQGLNRSTRYYYISGQLWSKENPDAFAGAHNFDGEFAIFDEASGIPAEIWPVQEGVFTEDIADRFWLAFSNPRVAQGGFFECFNKNKRLWRTTQIDSRTVEGISQTTYENIIEQYGEDSDQARVEVYGQFPKSGEDQFISPFMVDEAFKRAAYDDPTAPTIIGVDPARSGLDSTVIVVRKGRDLHKILRYQGEDTMEIVGRVIHAINEFDPVFTVIDSGGLGAGVFDRLKEQQYNVREVNFAWKSSNPTAFLNARAEIWSKMKDWLKTAAIPRDALLKDDLTSPNKKMNSTGSLQLEGKKEMRARGASSPDSADALALTFYYDVGNRLASKTAMIDRVRMKTGLLKSYGYNSGAWMG